MLIARKRRPIADPAEFAIEPITGNAEFAAAVAEMAKLEERLRQAEQREAQARGRARGAPPGRGNALRARDLLRGGGIPGTDPAREIAAAEEEGVVIRTAMAEQQAKINDIRGQLSFDLACRFRPQHDECLKAALDAMVILDDALTAILGCRARRIAAGYAPSDYALPAPIPFSAMSLGDPRGGSTDAAIYRRELEKLGVVKEGSI
jgi:hypothetical protein